jgi:hypothetical protein
VRPARARRQLSRLHTILVEEVVVGGQMPTVEVTALVRVVVETVWTRAVVW